MSEIQPCPQCGSKYAYPTDSLMMCPECGHEWNPDEVAEETGLVVKDANGNILQDGNTVVVIKDLPVKGVPKPIKSVQKLRISV